MSGWFGTGASLRSTISVETLSAKLADSVNGQVGQYANQFAAAALSSCPRGVDEYDWSLVLASICWRESRGGSVLLPKGPGGVGDTAPRWKSSIPEYAKELSLFTGRTKVSENGVTLYEIAPPNYAGASYAGWGYGLMQIDFATWRDWLDKETWKDPLENIAKGAEILSAYYDDLPSINHTIAAYNAGVTRVKRLDTDNVDTVTTGKDYSSDVLATAKMWGAKFV